MSDFNSSFLRQALARISLVDSTGKTLLDTFVAVAEKVTNYLTEISGVRPKDLAKAKSFDTVMKRVRDLLRDKIIVGHSLEHDFKAKGLFPYLRGHQRYRQVFQDGE